MSERYEFTDAVVLADASKRTITADGYLIAPATLATAGVFQYRAYELGLKDRKPNDIVNVYRSVDSLAKAVETFESQTITLDHVWTTAKNWKSTSRGDVRDVSMDGEAMVGTYIVRDAEAIKAIEDGKNALSNGYRAKVVPSRGTYKDKPYEFEQVDLFGNHSAIVDVARCGSSCRVGDSAAPEDAPTHKEAVMPVQRTHDGLTVTLENEQSGQVFDRLTRSLETITTERDTLKAATPKVKLGDKELTGDDVAALVKGKDDEIKALKDGQQTPEQIHALVVARSNAITSAREMVPDLKVADDQTAHAIRVAALDEVVKKDETAKAMLDAALGSTKLAEAQEPVVATAFNTIAAGLKKAKDSRRVADSRGQVGRLATATATSSSSDAGGDKDPRAAYIDSVGNAWKGPQTPKAEVN